MGTLASIGILLCLFIGLLFNALGVVGILRFPDVYTRLHADTKATTFGTIFTSLAVILWAARAWFTGGHDGQFINLAVHTVFAVVVLAITNATGAHAIARAAYHAGSLPSRAVTDRLANAQLNAAAASASASDAEPSAAVSSTEGGAA